MYGFSDAFFVSTIGLLTPEKRSARKNGYELEKLTDIVLKTWEFYEEKGSLVYHTSLSVLGW